MFTSLSLLFSSNSWTCYTSTSISNSSLFLAFYCKTYTAGWQQQQQQQYSVTPDPLRSKANTHFTNPQRIGSWVDATFCHTMNINTAFTQYETTSNQFQRHCHTSYSHTFFTRLRQCVRIKAIKMIKTNVSTKNKMPKHLRNFHQNVSVLVCILQQLEQLASSCSQRQVLELSCTDPKHSMVQHQKIKKYNKTTNKQLTS